MQASFDAVSPTVTGDVPGLEYAQLYVNESPLCTARNGGAIQIATSGFSQSVVWTTFVDLPPLRRFTSATVARLFVCVPIAKKLAPAGAMHVPITVCLPGPL